MLTAITDERLAEIQAERDRFAVSERMAQTDEGKRKIRENTDTIMNRIYYHDGVRFENGKALRRE